MAIVSVLGLAVLAVAFLLVFSIIQEFRFGTRAQRLSGRIVDFESVASLGTRVCSPVVEWVGPDGQLRRFRSALWSGWRRYEIGQYIGVLCGPAKGELRVCIDSFYERFGFELLMLVFLLFISSTLAFGFWLT